MNYYHGSPKGNIKQLKPQVSTHGKEYVYLSTNEVVATLYTVSNNFYTYGFDEASGVPVYTEYFPGALKEIYCGKVGHMYRCSVDKPVFNPTNIGCAFVCQEPVDVIDEIKIQDVYKRLMEFVDGGLLILRRYEELSEKHIQFIEEQIENEIIDKELGQGDTEYSKFIRKYFPQIIDKVIGQSDSGGRMSSIKKYEELAINAFPALLTEVYDGWVLRFSNGYTYRGNSVNPLYKSTEDLDKKIECVEKKYQAKGLPCVFKMTDETEDDLDQLLEARGYVNQKQAHIMTMACPADCESQGLVQIEDKIEIEWLEGFLFINKVNESSHGTAKAMLTSIGNPVICASIRVEGKMVACGLGVIEDKKVGLFDIVVDQDHRRKGYGSKICQAIMKTGLDHGAETAYLQVAVQNDKAIEMYKKMGFETMYTYWYRVKDMKGLGKIDD